MITYKQYKNDIGNVVSLVCSNGWTIPFDPANTMYANFKKEINEETAELQDADGNVMSAEEAKAYIATLPA